MVRINIRSQAAENSQDGAEILQAVLRSIEAIVSNTGHGASNELDGKSHAHEAATNSTHSSNEIESDTDFNETAEQKLERWRRFYSEGSNWYFDKVHFQEHLNNLLFRRLYNEVQYTVFETG